MTALDFPNAPTIGQTFAPGGSALSYMWDGTRWRISGGLGSPSGAMGYAYIQAQQTGIVGSAVDIAGLSVTFTAVAGRQYKITGEVYMSSTVAGDHAGLQIRDGAGSQQQSAQIALPSSAVLYKVHVEVVVSPPAGSTTMKLTAIRANGSGTVTVSAGVGYPAFILVEDITYQPGGGGGTAVGGPGAWTNLALVNGYTAFAGWGVPRWRLAPGDRVELAGLMNTPLLNPSTTLSFATIPLNVTTAGRILNAVAWTVGSAATRVAQIRVGSTGGLIVNMEANDAAFPAGSWVSLDNVSYTLT